MTTVTILRKSGKIVSVSASGHTGYAERGSDIVCAGVSAVTQTALLGLLKVVNIDIKHESNSKIGSLRFEIPNLPEQKRYEADLITETMLAGLLDLEKGYPKNIRIKEENI